MSTFGVGHNDIIKKYQDADVKFKQFHALFEQLEHQMDDIRNLNNNYSVPSTAPCCGPSVCNYYKVTASQLPATVEVRLRQDTNVTVNKQIEGKGTKTGHSLLPEKRHQRKIHEKTAIECMPKTTPDERVVHNQIICEIEPEKFKKQEQQMSREMRHVKVATQSDTTIDATIDQTETIIKTPNSQSNTSVSLAKGDAQYYSPRRFDEAVCWVHINNGSVTMQTASDAKSPRSPRSTSSCERSGYTTRSQKRLDSDMKKVDLPRPESLSQLEKISISAKDDVSSSQGENPAQTHIYNHQNKLRSKRSTIYPQPSYAVSITPMEKSNCLTSKCTDINMRPINVNENSNSSYKECASGTKNQAQFSDVNHFRNFENHRNLPEEDMELLTCKYEQTNQLRTNSPQEILFQGITSKTKLRESNLPDQTTFAKASCSTVKNNESSYPHFPSFNKKPYHLPVSGRSLNYTDQLTSFPENKNDSIYDRQECQQRNLCYGANITDNNVHLPSPFQNYNKPIQLNEPSRGINRLLPSTNEPSENRQIFGDFMTVSYPSKVYSNTSWWENSSVSRNVNNNVNVKNMTDNVCLSNTKKFTTKTSRRGGNLIKRAGTKIKRVVLSSRYKPYKIFSFQDKLSTTLSDHDIDSAFQTQSKHFFQTQVPKTRTVSVQTEPVLFLPNPIFAKSETPSTVFSLGSNFVDTNPNTFAVCKNNNSKANTKPFQFIIPETSGLSEIIKPSGYFEKVFCKSIGTQTDVDMMSNYQDSQVERSHEYNHLKNFKYDGKNTNSSCQSQNSIPQDDTTLFNSDFTYGKKDDYTHFSDQQHMHLKETGNKKGTLNSIRNKTLTVLNQTTKVKPPNKEDCYQFTTDCKSETERIGVESVKDDDNNFGPVKSCQMLAAKIIKKIPRLPAVAVALGLAPIPLYYGLNTLYTLFIHDDTPDSLSLLYELFTE